MRWSRCAGSGWMDAAFEELRGGHGLLRELRGVRVWGVDDGALVLGEDATHFVFCHQGALTIRQGGCWPHVLTAGMYASVPGKCDVRPVGQDLSRGMVVSALGWLGMMVLGGPLEERGRLRYIDGCTDSLLVPPVQVGLDPVHRMMSTIRHNRARGTHAVVRMADIVRQMADEGIPAGEIQKRLGMEREEVVRLVNRAGMPTQVQRGAAGLNKAWVPGKG